MEKALIAQIAAEIPAKVRENASRLTLPELSATIRELNLVIEVMKPEDELKPIFQALQQAVVSARLKRLYGDRSSNGDAAQVP